MPHYWRAESVPKRRRLRKCDTCGSGMEELGEKPMVVEEMLASDATGKKSYSCSRMGHQSWAISAIPK